MNESMINMFLLSNKRYLPNSKMIVIKEKLRRLDDSKFDQLLTVNFKDPLIVFLVSIFFGAVGADRFMVKSYGIAILKILTVFFIIPYLIDLLFIQRRTRYCNYENLLDIIG